MRDVPLGKGGLNGSELCLGTMYFGVKIAEEDAFTLMDYYYEQGGRFFDTANKYATWVPGFSEPVGEYMLGRWIKSRGSRKDVLVATKMGFPYADVPMGLSRKLILQEVDKSLHRLGLDHIDLLYAHTDDYDTPQEETLEAFHSLVTAGKVRSLGASNFYAWRLAKANELARENGWTPYSCLQARLSVLWPRINADFGRQLPASVEVLDFCQREELALLAYSPLLQGFFGRTDRPLPDEYDTPLNKDIIKLFREEGEAQNVSANTLVLSWMRAHGYIPLITGSTREQIKENLDSLNYNVSKSCDDRICDLYYPHRE